MLYISNICIFIGKLMHIHVHLKWPPSLSIYVHEIFLGHEYVSYVIHLWIVRLKDMHMQLDDFQGFGAPNIYLYEQWWKG